MGPGHFIIICITQRRKKPQRKKNDCVETEETAILCVVSCDELRLRDGTGPSMGDQLPTPIGHSPNSLAFHHQLPLGRQLHIFQSRRHNEECLGQSERRISTSAVTRCRLILPWEWGVVRNPWCKSNSYLGTTAHHGHLSA